MIELSKSDFSKIKIVEIERISDKVWNEFVYKHPNGNFFQTKHYYYLQHKKYKSQPLGFGLFVNEELRGVVFGTILYNFFWPIHLLTRRCIIIGGPLISDNNLQLNHYLMSHLIKHVKHKTIYIQLRNLWDMNSQKQTLLDLGFNYEDHLDIIHDLTQSTESIKSKISKNKRGNVSKSANKGTTFTEILTFQDFKIAVELVLKTYKKVGLPCPSREYFYNAFDKLTKLGILKTFAATYNNEMIGVRMELCYNKMVYDWFAGSDNAHSNKYPNDFLPFHILFWGKEHNFSKFDFGGAGKPNIPYGVREHKLKFGGELVCYGRFERVNFKFLMKIATLGLRAFTFLKSKIKS